jgi:hypothetical protein
MDEAFSSIEIVLLFFLKGVDLVVFWKKQVGRF